MMSRCGEDSRLTLPMLSSLLSLSLLEALTEEVEATTDVYGARHGDPPAPALLLKLLTADIKDGGLRQNPGCDS